MSNSQEFSNHGNLIFDWEHPDNPSAPLSNSQRNFILDLGQEIKELGLFPNLKTDQQDVLSDTPETRTRDAEGVPDKMNNVREFMEWYTVREDEWYDREDLPFKNYLRQLSNQKQECDGILSQVDECLKHLKDLTLEYQSVSNKTNALHQVSEELLADQVKLIAVWDAVGDRMKHFKSLDRFVQSLDNNSLGVHSTNLANALDELNDHIHYLQTHSKFKESFNYLSRYQQCQRRLLTMMRDAVASGLSLATLHASANTASHYAKFQVARHNLRPIIALMEERVSHSELYDLMLAECHEAYVSERQTLIGPSVLKTMEGLVATNTSSGAVVDLCSLMRAACAFLIHVSLDEHKLYQQFFTVQTDTFDKYLETLCVSLYDVTRPLIIHMKHLESLAELCSILRLEMLQEQVSTNREALSAFGGIAEQLLHDVQERLVFRAHMYLRTDVAEYKPSPGDLAYPEKLHLMQSIAQSMHEQEVSMLNRSESRASLTSLTSAASQDVSKAVNPPLPTSSPADLHGMWYPPVRRTLLCLSRLYRCVERPTFQGISQEALSLCMLSIKSAAQHISINKSPLDGEMFQIKHLLILREQIAPFQVDFTVKEMALDFSKMKTAAAQLINRRTRLFSLSSNNSLLEFLLEGSPEVREQWLDSRKDVDRALKASCEAFIKHSTEHLMPFFLPFLEQAENWKSQESMKTQPWATPSAVTALVQNALKSIKAKLPGLQGTMQLYLANRDTEFILYRPIRNNVVGCFTRLHQVLVSSGYTSEEQTQIGCPTAEQAYVLVSSVSLLQQHAIAQQQQRKISTSSQHPLPERKISSNEGSERKISSSSQPDIDSAQGQKKISFEGIVNSGKETGDNRHTIPPKEVVLKESDSGDASVSEKLDGPVLESTTSIPQDLKKDESSGETVKAWV
ncbi:hypothetical protein GE061_011651 [Apolygus lucorum]|uniref:Conserved oligomeric Golgi complex subunit 3 n=1 Tax=Apolygus lucorum TaxID=248454 RepID=A0A6A4K1R8_APOLU|nr:hypothetical protein GE061_011651 [Apolygus lucorum]